MPKYKVITQDVEINGTTRRIGDILEATEFKPATETDEGEAESLLKTKHIELTE